MKTPIRTLALACATLGSFASTQAADITQTANSTNGWNNGAYWNGTPPSAGNNYFSAASGTVVDQFTANGTAWALAQTIGTVRDNTDPGSNSTFAGDSLTLVTNTRLLGKVINGSTSTVNLVFGGGFFFHGGNTPGSATLAGTIRFANGTHLGALALNPNGTVNPMVLTINSTVYGGTDDTLQLTLLSEGSSPGTGNRLGHLIFAGDLSNFSGSIWVGTSVSGTNVASFYSVQSSATSATLILDINTHNFRYNLAGADTLFGAVQIGDSFLSPGTYDAAWLNANYGTGTQFFGDGSITVVPEPAHYAAAMLGMLVFTVVLRRKRALA
jgi:hypothetical protein